MRSVLGLGVLLAPFALGHPLESVTELAKRQANMDITILQFALTLEHLENVFYKGALQNFTSQDFMDTGYGPNYYNNLQYIASDEESHVKFLTGAISAAGADPVAACTYNFPYIDVASFITLSTMLEGVGTSAYLGGAPLITSKDYLTAAGSILVTEALHTSLQRNAIKAVPNANPYGTPLDPMSVFTLAAAFIVSCPASNAALPFTAFPSLAYNGPSCYCEGPICSSYLFEKRDDLSTWHDVSLATDMSASSKTEDTSSMMTKTETSYSSKTASPAATATASCKPPSAGATVSFTAGSSIPTGSFVTFVSGLMVVSVPGSVSDMTVSATIPAGISGQTYVMVTSRDVEGSIDDTAILFGPAILEVQPPPPSVDFGYLKE
ncbi:hypothetical protein LTR70_007449 [Exophiala xenobiotica]|uniref:Uncharacterized protein n=1 Tax=Lithohypha guttulata TaxID=1690604 RepID=A0ABR0K4Q5_9EURO|nr:hypothetical protein LTR24_006989 [Lithohypha guttulata]KAK5313806.1 hypothetical protein LTR70_007449 [Exophiala xenobiotica]